MAYTAVTVQDVSQGGEVVSFAAADNANGNKYANTGKERVLVRNTNASSRTVTAVAQKTSVNVDGLGVLTRASFVLTLAQNEIGMIPPLPPAMFSNSAGEVELNISGSDVTIAVVRDV